MSKFQTLPISQIKHLTSDAVEITFGNHDFRWAAGQYITLETMINGEDVRRSYSICSAPHTGQLSVGVKRVEGGKMSTYLTTGISENDSMQVMSPEGNFTLPEMASEFVFFAAGSGITPILSQVESLVHAGMAGQVKLIVGNRSENEAMFLEELKALEAKGVKTRFIYSDGHTGMPQTSGRLDFSKTTELLASFVSNPTEADYFVCGPNGMMESVVNALEDAGIAKEKIHLEYFSAPVTTEAPAQEKAAATAFEGTAKVTILLDDEETTLEVPAAGDVILDVALDNGLDAPYSCKGGVCTTCRALLEEGEVHMDNEFALTDTEKAEGYILTCQSHPRSAVVKLNYDE